MITTQLLDEELEKGRKERQATWSRIKTEAPDVAVFLAEVNQAFGKPEAVKVMIGGEAVLDKGEMLPGRQWPRRHRR